MKLLELINAAALKGGRTQEDAVLKEFIQKNQNIDVDVPKELEDAVNSLLNLAAAQNNEKVKDHYFNQFANAAESTVYDDPETFGFDSAELEELKKEKSFFKREKKRGELLKQKLAAAKKAGNKDDVKTYTDQIAELNGKIANLNKEHQQKLDQEKQSFYSKLKSRDLNSLIDSEDWADAYKEDRYLIGNARLNEKLAALKGTAVYDKENKLVLKAVDQEGNPTEADLYDPSTNTPVELKGLLSSIMAEKKYRKVATTPEPTTIVSGQPYTPGSPNGAAPGSPAKAPNPFRQQALQNLAELSKG